MGNHGYFMRNIAKHLNKLPDLEHLLWVFVSFLVGKMLPVKIVASVKVDVIVEIALSQFHLALLFYRPFFELDW